MNSLCHAPLLTYSVGRIAVIQREFFGIPRSLGFATATTSAALDADRTNQIMTIETARAILRITRAHQTRRRAGKHPASGRERQVETRQIADAVHSACGLTGSQTL